MNVSLLQRWGYQPFFSDSFTSLARPDLSPARVVSDVGARLEVVTADGELAAAAVAGRLRHVLPPLEQPTTGDWVAIAPALAEGPAVVHDVLPRRTQLVRRAAGRRDAGQVVAANVDTCLIVTSANRDANPRRVERYVAAVRDGGAAPVVVVSKADLCSADELTAIGAQLAAAAPGAPVLAVSAHRGDGLDALAAYLRPGHTVALVGSSGVGKSSLVNHLLGAAEQRVLPIDSVDRGRHATTRRQLFALPSGALVLDTPGMREFGLIAAGDGVDDTFAEIAALSAACRFRDCQHRGEPGCAVDAAIADGSLDPARRDALDKLERELAAAERRRDPAAARAERDRWRAIHKAQRARARLDPKQR